MQEDNIQEAAPTGQDQDAQALRQRLEALDRKNAELLEEKRKLRKFEQMAAQLPDGVDVQELLDFKRKVEQQQLESKGKYDEALKTYEQQYREREAQLQARVAELESENRELKVIGPAVAALADTVHDPDEVIRLRLKPDQIERETDGSVVVVDGYQRTPISDWARSSLPQYRLKAPKPAGTGAPVGRSSAELPTGSKNPFSREHYNLTEQARIYKTDPELYARLKAAASK